MGEQAAKVYVFDAVILDGERRPPERIYVDLSGPVGMDPAWKCSVWIDPEDRRRLNAVDPEDFRRRIESSGVFAFTDLFEWTLTDEELFQLDRFSKRGVEVIVPEVAERALRLAAMVDAVGLELDLARAPLFTPGTSSGMQLALSHPTVVGTLHHKPFSITAPAGWLTVRDGLLLCELIKMYVDQGFPTSRAVAVTVTDLCEAAGYSDKGGWQFSRASDALMRLRSATLRNVVRLEDGNEEHYTWGLIDAGWMRSGPEGTGQIRLSEELAGLINRGLLTYYDRATLRGLIDADEYAARLWMFLESESLGGAPRLYSIFSAPEGQPPAERDTPAIADLLGMGDWQRRRKVKDRVARAAAAVVEFDGRYAIAVERAKRQTMWNLSVLKRKSRSGAVIEPLADSHDDEVYGQGRGVYDEGRGVYGQGRFGVRPGAQTCTARGASEDEIPASHELNGTSAVSSTVSSTVKERDSSDSDPVDNFETWWPLYPRKVSEAAAHKAFDALPLEFVPEVIAATKVYAEKVRSKGIAEDFVMSPVTFIGPQQRWREFTAESVAQAEPEDDGLTRCGRCGSVITADELEAEAVAYSEKVGLCHRVCPATDQDQEQ